MIIRGNEMILLINAFSFDEVIGWLTYNNHINYLMNHMQIF